MTPQRITITIQPDVFRKLRHMQADMIKKSNSSVSMSKTVDIVLRRGMK